MASEPCPESEPSSSEMPPPSFRFTMEPLPCGCPRGVKLQAYRAQRPPSASLMMPMLWIDVLEAWKIDSGFTSTFSRSLEAFNYPDSYWECPPTSWELVHIQPFECVLLDAAGGLLRRTISNRAFQEHLEQRAQHDDTVVSFPNLGGDATLVVPLPLRGIPREAYGSIGPFLRLGKPQQHEVWNTVGASMLQVLESNPARPVWLNTAGEGVRIIRCSQLGPLQHWSPLRTLCASCTHADVLIALCMLWRRRTCACTCLLIC